MFGWLYILFGIGGKIGTEVKGSFHDAKQIEKNKDTFSQTYLDHKGKTRYIKNNRWVHTAYRDGERVLEDVETHEVYRNLSEEVREKKNNEAREKAIKEHARAYPYKPGKYEEYNNPHHYQLYKDIENGKVYYEMNRHTFVKQKRGLINLYADAKTVMFVGKSDSYMKYSEKQYKKEWDSYVDEEIEFIEQQKAKFGYKYTEEEWNEKLEKSIVKRRKSILLHYIPDDQMENYLKEVNKQQREYIANNDDMAYFSLVRG